MDPITGYSIAAGASALGGFFGSKNTNAANERIANARNRFEFEEGMRARSFSADQARYNRAFTDRQSARQMSFQERMSSTAVQRRMEDMKAAGINPILAGKFEGSTPAGAAGAGGIPATAKANAHGYTAQNEIQAALDSLNTAIGVKTAFHNAQRAEHEATASENKAKTTKPKGSIMDDIDKLYNKGKNELKEAPSWIGDKVGSNAKKVKSFIDNQIQSITEKYQKAKTSALKKDEEYQKRKLRNYNIIGTMR